MFWLHLIKTEMAIVIIGAAVLLLAIILGTVLVQQAEMTIVIIGAAGLLLAIILGTVLVQRYLRKTIEARCVALERCLVAVLQEKNDLLIRCADLEQDLEEKSQEKNDLLVKCADLEQDLEEKSQEKNDLSVRWADVENDLAAKLQENRFISVRCADVEKRLKAELQEKNDLVSRCADLEKDLEAESQEKNDLSVRLSAIIASRTQDGNTTIVDLSDENRPTKLAEYFADLYDTEWTDCFDELESQAIEESERIRILLKILTDIFEACLEWSTEDYFLLVQRAIDRTYIGYEGEPLANENEKSDSIADQVKGKITNSEKEESELPNDLLQPIKEIKKRRALKVLPTIHEFVQRKIPTLAQARFASTRFKTYIQKCTEFSWLAVVQDPPLVLLADRGTKFDRKLFKEYTRRRPFVEFVVWPALFVEDGGVILSKGVAQGTDKSQ